MNINYELYKIFYYVCIHKTISKAAEELFISQPAITQSINNLESKLNCKLFTRTKKGVVFTTEGKLLFEHVQKAFEEFEKGENALLNYKNLEVGTLKIGASTTVTQNVLMPYIEKFHKRYPNIDIQLTNALSSDLVTKLKNGSLDILFMNLPMEKEKNIKIIPIKKVQDIFVGNEHFYNLTNGKINLNDLKKYPTVFQKGPSNTRMFLDTYLKNNNVNIKPQNEIVSYNLVMDFVKSGFGIGYATKNFIKNDLINNKLYEIKVTPVIPPRQIGIALVDKTIPNYSVNKLLEIIDIKIN